MTNSVLTEACLALVASGLLSFGAYKRGSLSTSGGIAAAAVGFSVWLGAGRVGFAALCGFFLTSTLLGRVGKERKRPLQLDYEKGDRRDAWQVLANGGVAAVLAVAACVANDAPFPAEFRSGCATTLVLAAMASIASANADTWATELGVLSRRAPRSLWTWQPVPPGTSGAVSPGGLLAALGGALVVALITSAMTTHRPAPGVVAVLASAGFFGALLDSALGSLQRQYTCAVCGKKVEAKSHCDKLTMLHPARFAVLNNDAVNALANAGAAVVVLLLG